MSLTDIALAREAELEQTRHQGWFSANPAFNELGDMFVRAAFEFKPVRHDLLKRAERAYEHSYNFEKLHKLNELYQKLSSFRQE
jgi:hypothetical protein